MKSVHVMWATGVLVGVAIGAVAACTDTTEPLTENAGTDASVGGSAGSSGQAGASTGGGAGTSGSSGAAGAAGSAGNVGSWSATGAMADRRGFEFTPTSLASGKVLVAGGHVPGSTYPITAKAELYDPATGTWSAAGSLAKARASACSTLLPSGKVLVAGGSADPGGISTAEIYLPDSNTWVATSQPMSIGHVAPSCALLGSGKVLVAGGLDTSDSKPTAVAELYDPDTDTFTATGSMATARAAACIALLESGKVLVVSGGTVAYGKNGTTTSSELYDPATGQWSAAGDIPIGVGGATCTRLLSGKVLVAGGCQNATICGPESTTVGEATRQANLYDPNTGTWTATGDMLNGHVGHSVLQLSSGDVLLVSGSTIIGAENVTERYNATTGTWGYGPSPLVEHGSYFGAAKLGTGKWLVMGGLGPRTTGAYQFTDAAEIFTE
jgi:large repetitive protein